MKQLGVFLCLTFMVFPMARIALWQKLFSVVVCCLILSVPLARADDGTAESTVGILEAHLVTKTLEPAGSVEIWNTRMEFNIIVTPMTDEYLLSKVFIYLSTEPAPPPDLYVEPDFGQWPYGETYEIPTAYPYALNVHLSEIEGLEWDSWGDTWLPDQLVTVAVRVEMKSIYTVPVTFYAWAINPYYPLELQRTGWGDKTYAMVYELQFPQ